MASGAALHRVIFALSSAPGRAGVAVIRLSGTGAADVVRALAGHELPAPRRAVLRRLQDPRSGDLIDRGLVLWMPAPASFTGEDCAEFHVHGGPAVTQAMLAALGSLSECRPAEAGEFARRAFEAGKMDVTEAEGLADLIEAETDAQRKQALRQASGGLSGLAEAWREELIAIMALVEAAIDFSDEGDVAEDAIAQAEARAAVLEAELRNQLEDGHRGEILRDGYRVALLGPPNAGKSSLLNALARREVAIVSSQPGTTRDVIEVRLNLNGRTVVVTDTAGLREAAGEIEREGMRRAIDAARSANLVVWMVDGADADPPTLPDEIEKLAASGVDLIRVVNKTDQLTHALRKRLASDVVQLSVVTGEGLPALISLLSQAVADRTGGSEPAVITRARHRLHLNDCYGSLRAFIDGRGMDAELRAEDLRRAAVSLGRLTGRVDVEDVLDQVFGRFCIGK